MESMFYQLSPPSVLC